jgi:hypothetical protein
MSRPFSGLVSRSIVHSNVLEVTTHENYGKFGAAEVEKKVATESAEDVRIIGCVIGDVKHSLHIDLICTDNLRGRSEGFVLRRWRGFIGVAN